MPLFTYEGHQELVFPSLGVTVKHGDTFEAPEGFSADNVVSATGKKATKNATATTVSEETATEPKAVENTSEIAESDALDAVATPSA